MRRLDDDIFELEITQYMDGHDTMRCYTGLSLSLFLLRRPRQEEEEEFFRTNLQCGCKIVTPGYRKTIIQSDSHIFVLKHSADQRLSQWLEGGGQV